MDWKNLLQGHFLVIKMSGHSFKIISVISEKEFGIIKLHKAPKPKWIYCSPRKCLAIFWGGILPGIAFSKHDSNHQIFKNLSHVAENCQFLHRFQTWFCVTHTTSCQQLLQIPKIWFHVMQQSSHNNTIHLQMGQEFYHIHTFMIQLYHLESRWRNSHVLVFHGPFLSHLLGVAPSTFARVYPHNSTISSPPKGSRPPSLPHHQGNLPFIHWAH